MFLPSDATPIIRFAFNTIGGKDPCSFFVYFDAFNLLHFFSFPQSPAHLRPDLDAVQL